mgnify:CR=1 FL=1
MWVLFAALWIVEGDAGIAHCPDNACRLAHWNREIAEALETGDVSGAGHVVRRIKGVEVLPPSHPERVLLEGNLGALQLARGDSAGALRHFELAWRSRAGMLGPEIPKLLNNWALALLAAGRPKDARAKLEAALAYCEPGADAAALTVLRANLATVAAIEARRR